MGKHIKETTKFSCQLYLFYLIETQKMTPTKNSAAEVPPGE